MARKPKKRGEKPKKPGAKPKKATRRSLAPLAYGLFLLMVAGILAIKGLESPIPEERPFDEELRSVVVAVLRGHGLEIDDIRERTTRAGLELEASMPADASLTRINLDLTTEVEEIGGEILAGKARARGIEFEIGHRGEPSMKLRVRRMLPTTQPESTPRSGVGPGFKPWLAALHGDQDHLVAALPRVAIIIDDIGHNEGTVVADLLTMDAPLTFSILPLRPHSASLARRCGQLGREVLVHLPMEPAGYPGVDPGDGAILCFMQDDEIRGRVREAWASVAGAVGLNNHMGSRATTDLRVMNAVMEELAVSGGAFFVDSFTSHESIGFSVAKAHGLPALASSIFLDQADDPDSISTNLDRLAQIARKRGSAVAIGHPRRNTRDVLRRRLSEFEGEMWVLVPASMLFSAGVNT